MTETTWTETDALAPTGPTLAQLMLTRGAQLVGPAPRTVEQAVSAAEAPHKPGEGRQRRSHLAAASALVPLHLRRHPDHDQSAVSVVGDAGRA